MKQKILHLDIARKYVRPSVLKEYIGLASECGYSQLQLYFSDNQGFRLALDDMTVTANGIPYDLSPALGDGYPEPRMDMCSDGTNRYLTQAEMAEIIAYAADQGVTIVPCLNTPGHMGAILQHFPQFRYQDTSGASLSSLDIANQAACQFALALLERYISFFAAQGCKTFNLVADEFANDAAGFTGLYEGGKYPAFMEYLNAAIGIVKQHGMIPRVFNDALYMDETGMIEPQTEVCYCFTYPTSAQQIAEHGHPIINGTIDLFWVLGKEDWQVSPSRAETCDLHQFVDGSTVDHPAGAMLCIWCDKADALTDTEMLEHTKPVIRAFAKNNTI